MIIRFRFSAVFDVFQHDAVYHRLTGSYLVGDKMLVVMLQPEHRNQAIPNKYIHHHPVLLDYNSISHRTRAFPFCNWDFLINY